MTGPKFEFYLDTNWKNLAKRLKTLNGRRIAEDAVTDVAKHVHEKAATYPDAPAGSTYRRQGILGKKIVHTRAKTSGNLVSAEVGIKLHYAVFVEEGTGIYGPKRQYIVPKTAKRLAWKATKGPSNGQWIRAKRVRGMRPWRYMAKAFESGGPYALRRYEQAFYEMDRAAGGN